MGIVNSKEFEYINNLINYGKESTILDFKEEWYNLKYKRSQYEFIKDCISFLNVSMEIDKYIIIGVKEDKENGIFTVVGVEDRNEENNIQEIIIENIEPIPQIEIITRFKVGEKEVDIIKIKKENKDFPYLFKKNFNNKAQNFQKNPKGLGYIRHGSASHQISRNELTNMFFKKQGTIYGYFNIEANINYKYLSDTMIFLNSMDALISKEALDTLSNSNLNFKSKIKNIFQELIIEGILFNEDKNILEFKNHICKMIIENKNEYAAIREVIDDGENSLIILIFCACYNWYKISNNPKIKFDIENDVAIINFDVEKLSGENYKEIDNHVTNLNDIIRDMNNLLMRYSKNIKMFKIEEIKYDDESSKYFVQSNIKFRVSEDVIPLLIEPLYKQSNKMEIALREMLQNSIDACKLISKDDYIGKIEIRIKNEDDKIILTFTDNGIGMSLEDIREYYLTVGKSKKIDSEIPVVGQFGIGALSMFLVGKKAVVQTKKSQEDEYRFELFEDKKTVANLTKKILNSDDSYTKIQVELNEELNSKDLKGLIKELGIDRWVISKFNLNINFGIGDDLYYVPNIESKKNKFQTIHDNEKLKIRLYDIDKEEDNEKKSEDANLENILKAKNIVLYNDILIKSKYDFRIYRNLNELNIPFLVIEGKTSKEEVSIELSRNTANIGGTISKAVASEIYGNQIKKIKEYLNENQGKTNSIKMRSELIKLVQSYLKLPTLLLTENKIIIANSKMYDDVDNKEIFIIKSNSLYDECLNFDKDVFYIVEDLSSNKSNIADMIEYGQVILISVRFLHKYIIYANNSSNGFRMCALKILLKDVMPYVNWELNYVDLWKEVEIRRNEIINSIEEKSLYGIYCYGDTDKNIVKKMFNEKIQNRDLIVSVSDITNYSITHSYDNLFDEIINSDFNLKDVEVVEEAAATLDED